VVFAAIATAALAAGAVTQARRRRSVLRGQPGEERRVVSSGNSLAYRCDNREAAGPVIFFEAALAATGQHWERIRAGLAERFTTVVYERAGYGSSEYHGGREYALADAAADFADLSSHVVGDRPVVIVGHCLGGYLATRSAALLGDRVRGLVLVEASHPAELGRSARLAADAEVLNTTLRLMAPSMRLGMGDLLQVPPAVDRLPEAVRHAAVIQYRDSRLWTAAHREWKATVREFEAFSGELPPIGADVLVLSAAATMDDEPVQLEMHKEYVTAAKRGRIEAIDAADHDTILTASNCATQVVEHITMFVAGIERVE
jgi:pimeloyl-ACP methyl ester carboxylesterase